MCGLFSDGSIDDDIPLHPLLEEDIQRLQFMYGEHSCSYRVLSCIADMTLYIHIPTSVLEKIEISQASSTLRGGAVQQLQNIAISFCQSSLRDLTNQSVAEAVSESKGIRCEDVVCLVEMGFLETEARCALKRTNGSKEDAVAYLLDSQSRDSSECSWENFASKEMTSSCEKNKAPSLEYGFLVQLYQYLSQRLLTLNNYCPICDCPHPFAQMSMLKPTVCHRDLCIFSFTTLGLMNGVVDSIAASPEVTDLLIQLTAYAALSKRQDIILTPYPAFVDPRKPNELAMHEECKDIYLLRTIINHLPQSEELFRCNGKETQKELEKRHPLCFPLLRWIIHSNRSYIVALPEHKQIKLMGTNHQFLMRSMPPLEEKQFIEKRKKHGSIFAFHGSPIENWHSIIREGLIVASGTRRQIHGAAYGKGIYLSPNLEISINYSPSSSKKNQSVPPPMVKPKDKRQFLHGNLLCIALCEVINDDMLKKHQSIWVCSESSNVCTRFFFVFDESNPASEANYHTNTENTEMLEQIRYAIQDTLS
ncbi:poly [ADP-ribose] polymerase [Elysia marginata]|uniref:Poly [ADP-ribose] polymerase n=1 Tax=Elysia marginata TaxID=1093978 RepID=A0AAV4HA99_9GAST|nr:poly [ADP-ribose] polymerase [Elysia marginata]